MNTVRGLRNRYTSAWHGPCTKLLVQFSPFKSNMCSSSTNAAIELSRHESLENQSRGCNILYYVVLWLISLLVDVENRFGELAEAGQ